MRLILALLLPLLLALLLPLLLAITAGGLQLGDKIIQIDSLDVVKMMRLRASDPPGTGTTEALSY